MKKPASKRASEADADEDEVPPDDTRRCRNKNAWYQTQAKNGGIPEYIKDMADNAAPGHCAYFGMLSNSHSHKLSQLSLRIQALVLLVLVLQVLAPSCAPHVPAPSCAPHAPLYATPILI